MKSRTGTPIIAAFLLALLLLAAVGLISYRSTQDLIDESMKVGRTHEIVATIEALSKNIGIDAARYRGYIITGNNDFLAGRQQTAIEVQESLNELHRLLQNSGTSYENLIKLEQLIIARRQWVNRQTDIRKRDGFEAAQRNIATGEGEELLTRIFATAGAITNGETTLLSKRQAETKKAALAAQKAIMLGGLLAVGLVGLALWQLSRELRKLARTEGMFRGLLEAAPDAMVIADRGGIIWRVNAETERIFGYAREEMIGRSLEMLMPERFRSRHSQGYAKFITAPKTQPVGVGIELYALKKDGTEFPVEISLAPLHSEQGLLVSGAIRDITLRRQAQEQIRQYEQFRAAILDAIPAEIAVLDASGSITAVNEPWLRFGRDNFTPSPLRVGVGDNYLAATRESQRAGSPFAGKAIQGIQAVLDGSAPEFFMEYASGSGIKQRWFFMHVLSAPAVGGAVVAHTDISRRKEAEHALHARTAELETVLREVPVAIFISYDRHSNVINGNPAACKLLHAEKNLNFNSSSPGANFEILVEGKEVPPRELPMQRASSTGEPVLGAELEVIFSDGSSCRILGNAVPLFDEDGTVRGSIGTFIDITEHKAAEEALRNFNTELEARVKERTDVLESAMAKLREEIAERQRLEEEILQISERQQMRIGQDLHDDLGQQLVGIAMHSDMLANELQREGHPKAGAAKQLNEFVSWSIKTSRNLAKSFYPVELERAGLIVALQDLAERTNMLSKVHCEVVTDDDFPIEKSAAIHLYRIVQESISNAIKHGHASHIRIACSTHGNHRILSVTDNGTGFTAPEEGEWTGMGLHLFQYRARLIGASLAVRRGEMGGCEVTCTIPIRSGESQG
jgi:PAS domain S-box-containing protein